MTESAAWLNLVDVPEGYTAEVIDGADPLREADELYRRVFGYSDPRMRLNPYLVHALAVSGGSSVGVRDAAGELVAYAYGFAATEDGGPAYHYSQTAVVDPRAQGSGLGTVLKQLQGRCASAQGQREMRWTFDPLLARNAHFNLNKLRATGIRALPNYYDEPGTDRLMVRWLFDDPPLAEVALPPAPEADEANPVDEAGRIVAAGSARWVLFPTEQVTGALDAEAVQELRTRVMTALVDTLGGGLVIRGMATLPEKALAAYYAVPEGA